MYGEGPTNATAGMAGRGAEGRSAPAEQATRAARFGKSSRPDLTAQDPRFTTKGTL
jgi:hypothetical protein